MALTKSSTVLLVIILCSLAAAGAPAPIKWTAPYPDPAQPNAGMPLIAGTEHVLIYHAEPDPGTYNHGPKIVHHDGVYTVLWYSHAKDEDAPGQRILFSSSPDGHTWSSAEPLFDSLSPMRPLGETGAMMGPRDFRLLNGRLYGYAGVANIMAESQADGGDGKTKTVLVKKRISALLRRIEKGRPAGPPFWKAKAAPEGFSSVVPYTALDETTQADVAELVRQEKLENIGPLPEPAEKAKLCEAIHYVLDDKREVRLFRDDLYSLRMFASMRASSADPWPKAVKTNIPDSPSLSCVGRLPDGQFYLIGNHIPKQWRRDPLMITLSRDGLTFDRSWAIRSGAPALRHKGRHKGPGFQYPGATVVGDDLWVAYSIGKEDIAVTRIPLAALGGK